MAGKWWSSNPARLALNGVGLLILLGLAIYLEVPRERNLPAGRCELFERGDVGESATAFARIAASGYRNVRSRRVTLVAFREGVDPARVLNNVCEQRWYSARLIPQLATAGAALIVFDKFFGPDSCPPGDQGTSDLSSALTSSSVPVVVGVGSHAPESDPRNACLIANKSLEFRKSRDINSSAVDRPIVYQGLIRLNSDPKKVPLNWYSYENDQAFKDGRQPSDANLGTLAWVAATLVDKNLKNESGLVRLRATGQHPFTSFISPDTLSRADALSILCSSPAKGELEKRYQMTCVDHPLSGAEIRGRVIVIGDDVLGRDRHMLFGDDVPGVYLQANYIESLLDGRYLRPLGAGWDFAIFASWVAFLYLAFWMQPEVALVLSLLVGYLVRYLIVQLVLLEGLYPQIWVLDLGTLALGLKYIEARGHLIVDAIKERAGAHGGD
jgi:CHASE2 domain-containing sensor protein